MGHHVRGALAYDYGIIVLSLNISGLTISVKNMGHHVRGALAYGIIVLSLNISGLTISVKNVICN